MAPFLYCGVSVELFGEGVRRHSDWVRGREKENFIALFPDPEVITGRRNSEMCQKNDQLYGGFVNNVTVSLKC